MDMHSLEKFVDDLEVAGLDISRDVSARDLTTYRLGGSLKYFLTLNSIEDIQKLSEQIAENKYGLLEENNVFILGNGSNVIVSDNGFEGIVFKFGQQLTEVINHSEQDAYLEIEVGAGMLLPKFARTAPKYDFFGCEFYVGIPGTVGGAVAMNAGGHGKQTSDVLSSVKVLSLEKGNIQNFTNAQCDFSYRHSKFKTLDLIISATFKSEIQELIDSKKELDSIVKWRRENQPGGRNIGSVFQNPENTSAGTLIEKCGLKGHKIGGAFVSEKHANFIQADDGAKASDVVALIEHVRKVVREQTGIELKNEVRYIGFDQNG